MTRKEGNLMNKKRQNYSINGVKFFQAGLDLLKAEHERSPLSAAAIATYILFHFKADDFGRVNAKELSLSTWANSTKIPYTTIHSGREVLFARGLVKEIIIAGEPYYQITNFDRWNSPELAAQGVKLSYFRVSYKLLKDPVLKSLVSSRNSAGLFLLLDLFNAITRAIGNKIKNSKNSSIEDIVNVSKEYTMNTLKTKTKQSALKVRQFIEAVKTLFVFEAEGYSERIPSKDRVAVTKKNNVIQIVIRKFKVKINPEMVHSEEDELETQTLEASLRKEVISKLDHFQIPKRNKDIRDIMAAFKQEVIKIMKYSSQPLKVRNRIIRNIFEDSLRLLTDYYTAQKAKDPRFRIKSLGGYMRRTFIQTFKNYLEIHISLEDKIDMGTSYFQDHGTYPLTIQQNNKTSLV